ncbi:hypothetical protein LXL04_011877 [Taraxacum kok-saghyz]
MWVMLEFPNVLACYNFRCNETVRGWFSQIIDWSRDFVPKERLVWLDIEGMPLRAWCRLSVELVVAKWGTIVHMEENFGANLASSRICLETQHMDIISDVLSVCVDELTSVVRVKEVTGWSPSFFAPNLAGPNERDGDAAGFKFDMDVEADLSDNSIRDEEEEHSPDPFNLRDLIWETDPSSAKQKYINRINKEVEVEETNVDAPPHCACPVDDVSFPPASQRTPVHGGNLLPPFNKELPEIAGHRCNTERQHLMDDSNHSERPPHSTSAQDAPEPSW